MANVTEVRTETWMYGGMPDQLKDRLGLEVGWPADREIPAAARYASVCVVSNPDAIDNTTIVEILDETMEKVLDRVVM